MKQNKMIGNKARRIAATLAAAFTAMFATSAALAEVNNLESYHFRFDFSKGTANFIPAADPVAGNALTNYVGNNVSAVEGPNGAGSATHVTSQAWSPFNSGTNNDLLNADWTLAMCFRPGTVEGGTIVSLGRLPGSNSDGATAIAICSSSDTSKLYVTVVTRKSSTDKLEKKNVLTELGDVTDGFHTLVIVHKSNSSDKKGTLYFYWDGASKGSYTLTSGYIFGKASSNGVCGMQFNKFVTRGATEYTDGSGKFVHKTIDSDSNYAFYDLRLYPGQFSADDATAYARLYPADRMGSLFRPNAYIEASGTNKNANVGNYIDTGYLAKGASTRFVADYQFLDTLGQQRIFGARGTFVQGLYIRGSAASGGTLAWNFMGTGKWVNMSVVAVRSRQIAMFDRVGKTIAVTNYDGRAQFYYNNSQSDFLKDTSNADSTTYLFAENNSGAKCWGKARIYSFEADESGTPVHFFAPTMQDGKAGFKDIITGDFKGDGSSSPERALRFYNGVGCADDYKYENETLYAKLYATSDGNGTVSVADGAAAASAEGWVPHGGTLALEAVPAANMEFKEWIGDTWAIADDSSATDASIDVSTPYAVQLQATFKPAVNALLTIAADGADVVNWSEADWRNIDNSEETITAPEDKNVTIVAHKSFTLTLDMDVALSNLTVQADANCVVTLEKGDGSLVTVETIVESGVLKQGTAGVLGTTPKLTVKAGGTFDVNNLAADKNMVFSIAGAGAGSWPWALTSSANMDSSTAAVGIVDLADDATIGANCQMCIGIRYGDTFSESTGTKSLTLNGYTLTKTGAGKLWFRRPYSTNEGTIDVQTGTLCMNDWSGGSAAYGEKCISNIVLVAREGTTVNNEMNDSNTQPTYTLYFKSIDISGATLASLDGAGPFGVLETLSGHGSIAKLAMADGATAVLDGDLTVSDEMAAVGDLSLTRAAGVETNVTVAATGTLTATGAITVGAGVIFDIGANRPTGTLTVDDDATLVLRQTNLDEDEIVVNASSQPQNIIVYDPDGFELQNPVVSYADGTLTIRVALPHWTNTDGTGSLDSLANWNYMPANGANVVFDLTGDVVVTASEDRTFGRMAINGAYSVDFTGAKLQLTAIDVPEGCTATLATLDGIDAGGVTGVGTLVLAPGAAEAVTISGLSSFTGDLGVTPDHSMTGTLTCAATSLKKFTLNGTTNVVFTLVNGTGGSFKANEIIVAGGVLQQGTASVLGETPKLTVLEGGTFDVNRVTINTATKLHIAGAGAGDWPWAVCSSSTMSSGNYLADITLLADATIGGPGQLKIGASSSLANKIVLNNHKLTFKGYLATLRNLNTDAGTVELAPGYIITLNTYNNLNSDKNNYTNTTLIIREDARVVNQTNRKIYATNVQLDGGNIWAGTETSDYHYGFGPLSTLSGHGMIAKLDMPGGTVYKPDGLGYLNVTNSLTGTITVDLSGIDFTSRTAPVPLLKVPTSLADTARTSLSLTSPTGWKLKEKTDGENVTFTLRKPKGVMVIAY